MREFEEEIIHMLNLVTSRKGKNHGKMTLNFLLNTLPSRFSKRKIEEIFKDLPVKTKLFKKRGVSMVITPLGKKIVEKLK
jgi:hypothetical protein